MARNKVYVAEALLRKPLAELMGMFDISKATASRLRERGWYFEDYRAKQQNLGEIPAEMLSVLSEDSKFGCLRALQAMNRSLWMLRPYEFSGLQQEALETLVRLSGHADFGHEGWRRVAAKNAAMDAIRNWSRWGRYIGDAPLSLEVLGVSAADGDESTAASDATIELYEKVKQGIVEKYGEDTWEEIRMWAGSRTKPSKRVADILEGLREEL